MKLKERQGEVEYDEVDIRPSCGNLPGKSSQTMDQ